MLKILPKPTEERVFEGFYEGSQITKTRQNDEKYGEEGYALKISEEGIEIFAKASAGFFYAERTLLQLKEEYKDKLPLCEIFDKPLYSYRGFMLDCSRHFFSVEEVKRQIETASLLKLNKFHWHLTDEQGWRMEIRAFPLLTKIGSKRAQTRGDGIPVEGFYTVEEMKDVVEFCAERFIEVIPEVDMPGHFAAAIAAYPHLGCRDEKINVRETFGISKYIACAGKEEVYDFCFKIFDEMEKIFPSKFVHLGGDEAVKASWQTCPDCRKTMKIEGLKNEEELQGYFMSKMVEYLSAKGKTVINWNDGLIGGNVKGNLAVQYWKENAVSVNAAKREAENGRQIIVSPFMSYYLDYPYGMTPLKKCYNYTPIFDKKSILGVEAPLWTEFVSTRERMDYMIYPRLLAVAERGWSEKADYEGFLTRSENLYKILSSRGIGYAKEPNPGFIKGLAQVIGFFTRALDKTMLKAARELKAAKNKARRESKKLGEL